MPTNRPTPRISVVILNYNGARWLDRCLDSLTAQTIFDQIEVIIADNLSTDGSDRLAEQLLRNWVNGKFVQNGSNVGFCEGNNRGAAVARGDYLFFLNNDTWLETNCLEVLLSEAERVNALVATPMILDYDSDTIQSPGGAGFDIFGLLSIATPKSETYEVLVCGGCSFFIDRKLFERIGGFDPEIYLYADEYDLSWRAVASGAKAIVVAQSRMHHRGAANVNPKGESKIVETRTSDSKRFYTNRNNLMVLMKNAQHVLLLLIPIQLALLFFEAVVLSLMIRRWSFVKRAYVDAFADLWRLRKHTLFER